jgi:hypothetical protein
LSGWRTFLAGHHSETIPMPVGVAQSRPSQQLSRWRCPGCGWRAVQEDGRLACVNCARSLTPLVYELIEFNPHPLVDEVGSDSASTLIPFWITAHRRGGPLGFGVTGHSLADAREILAAFGCEVPVESDVIAHVRYDHLDPRHVTPTSGPMVVRGLWYPFIKLGL